MVLRTLNEPNLERVNTRTLQDQVPEIRLVASMRVRDGHGFGRVVCSRASNDTWSDAFSISKHFLLSAEGIK